MIIFMGYKVVVVNCVRWVGLECIGVGFVLG